MTIPEYNILKECIKVDYNLEFISQLLAQEFSIDNLRELSYAHGVLPIVFNLFNQHLDHEDFPLLIKNFKKSNNEISKKNFFMTGQLLSTIKIFSEKKINCIPIKGPILSLEIYNNTYMRQFSDLDILVNKTQFYKAAEALESFNFKCTEDIHRIQYKAIRDTHQDFSFINQNTGTTIELHWVLDKTHRGVLADFQYLHNTSRRLTYHGIEIKLLNFDIQLFYLCIHGSKHRWERLEWICDIDRLIRTNKNIQWQEISSHAKKSSMYIMYILGLAVSNHFCNTPLSDKNIRQAIKHRKIQRLLLNVISLQEENYFLYTKPKGIRWKEIIFKVQLQDTLLEKFRNLFYAFFPLHRDDICNITMPEKISLWQLPFYRVRRKFRH